MAKKIVTFLIIVIASYRLIFLVFRISLERIKIALIVAVSMGIVFTHFYELPNYSPTQIIKKSKNSKQQKKKPTTSAPKKPNMPPLMLKNYLKKDKPTYIPYEKTKQERDNKRLNFG